MKREQSDLLEYHVEKEYSDARIEHLHQLEGHHRDISIVPQQLIFQNRDCHAQDGKANNPQVDSLPPHVELVQLLPEDPFTL